MKPNRTNKKLYQLTPLEPLPFLKQTALEDLDESRCVLCHQKLEDAKHYCLIGRHVTLGETERVRWLEFAIEKTTKYGYQGAYVKICNRCYRKHQRIDTLASLCVLPLLVAFLVLFVSIPLQCAGLRLHENDVFIALWGGSWVLGFIGLGLFYFIRRNSSTFSYKTVEVTEILPAYGVPDFKHSPYSALIDEAEMKEIINSKQKQ